MFSRFATVWKQFKNAVSPGTASLERAAISLHQYLAKDANVQTVGAGSGKLFVYTVHGVTGYPASWHGFPVVARRMGRITP